MLHLIKRIGDSMKKVPDFENYTIDKNGVVRSGKTVKTQTLGKNGYLYVTLYKNNSGKKLYIHRLMAILFLENKEGKRTVNHINGIKTDNRLENLEWATDRENIKHAYDTGLNKGSSRCTLRHKRMLLVGFFRGESLTKLSKNMPFNNVTASNQLKKYCEQLGVEDRYEAEVAKQRAIRGRKNGSSSTTSKSFK